MFVLIYSFNIVFFLYKSSRVILIVVVKEYVVSGLTMIILKSLFMDL